MEVKLEGRFADLELNMKRIGYREARNLGLALQMSQKCAHN
jgi:hypothetical protein